MRSEIRGWNEYGIGLDVLEWTHLVKKTPAPLAPGMCFSNEPLICIYGEFGVRLEYHFYIIEDEQYISSNRTISWKILSGT